MSKKLTVTNIIVIIIAMALVLPVTAQISLDTTENKVPLDLPSSFDLRDVNNINYVTSIKSQSGGTCWTHGALAAIESNLLITGMWKESGVTDEPNLAEYHLDWWNGFNQHYNDDISPLTGGLTVHNGGDYRVTSAYLARGDGAIYCPDANDDTESDYNWFEEPPQQHSSSYDVYYVPDIEWYTIGDDLEGIDTLKQALMTHGALGTSFCVNSQFIENYTHYQPPETTNDPNHAVAIIGWDDEKNTPASQLGAWLCKNSWGSGYGEEGYFWISYYDKHCCRHPEMGTISFQDVEPLRYSHIYYHDYHGWRDTLTEYTEAFNAFVAENDEVLVAVSFFTPMDNTPYEVKIYDQFANGELLDELLSQQGTINHTGFHTLSLDKPVKIMENDDFYIYVKLEGGQPYDRTSEVPVLLGSQHVGTLVESSARPGESYYRSNGQWLDLYYLDSLPYPGTANFCMKGLVIPQEIQISLSGGWGASARITNNNAGDLSNIKWSMMFEGSVFIHPENEGVISMLPSGGNADIHSGFVFGFGFSDLIITVDAMEKIYPVLVLGPFVLVR
jgi:C1A family cysteine protease